ncbi:MAG TPA: hypothetical protein VJ476_02730 [Rhizomicrobium sp.]|nr:hypothetical protein [Rhizomicrobium sp.]
MSSFTPLTADLFARKGEALPSAAKPALLWTRATPPSEVSLPPFVTEPVSPATPLEKPHRFFILLSAQDHQRLGIAAVKKGVTRHQIVRAALDTHLDRLKREFGGCACIAMGGSCHDGCRDV